MPFFQRKNMKLNWMKKKEILEKDTFLPHYGYYNAFVFSSKIRTNL